MNAPAAPPLPLRPTLRQPGARRVDGVLRLPPVLFGISALGNLYRAVPDATKAAIIAAGRAATDGPALFDGAGKYGAGLALERLGIALREGGATAGDVLISNKLGWRRTPLTTPEPTFEPGAWVGLAHDAVQDISHDGILRCFDEGNRLLGAPFSAGLVSVHDPDEYLAAAGTDGAERQRRWQDVLGAYRALDGLRRQGVVQGVGIGSKDWQVIRAIAAEVHLDWAMLACSLTVYHHPPELLEWVARTAAAGTTIIDSALFHGGFLTGGEFFDYRRVDPATDEGRRLLAWRTAFDRVCAGHGVKPAHVCVQYAFRVPGVSSIALNTTDPARVAQNIAMALTPVPEALWAEVERL